MDVNDSEGGTIEVGNSLRCVMKTSRSGIHHKRSVRLDHWIGPSCCWIMRNDKHVIGLCRKKDLYVSH